MPTAGVALALGALPRGSTRDTSLEWMYRYARQARIVDGASEVHKMVLARQFLEQDGDFWRWDGPPPGAGAPAG
jgi:acyl-CoA dehydrogenase